MVSTFQLVAEDFLKELTTVQHLLSCSEASVPGHAIDADVRLAASNASMLLIAASFEEFVRQSLKEAASEVLERAAEFSDLPRNLVSSVWERSTYILKGVKFGSDNFDAAAVSASMQHLKEFCLGGDLSVDVSSVVAYNQNNMRVKEINDLFRRIGLSDFCSNIGKHEALIDFFGAPSPEKSHAEYVAYLERFYTERNDVAHSIASRRVVGSSDLIRHLEFFRAVASALTANLDGLFPTATHEG